MSKNKVIVLQNGYCTSSKDGKSFMADCSVTLIKSPDVGNILVDTSGPWNKEKLIEEIESQNITLQDIGTVVCTHGHSDHVGNLNIFPATCKIIVGFDISLGNLYEEFNFKEQQSYPLSPTIDVIATPGHTGNDVSVVVRNTEFGTIVVAGDLFENEYDIADESIWKSNSENPDVQRKNRERVLTLADFVVPGHGKMFSTH